MKYEPFEAIVLDYGVRACVRVHMWVSVFFVSIQWFTQRLSIFKIEILIKNALF